jgi:hypothetical protein
MPHAIYCARDCDLMDFASCIADYRIAADTSIWSGKGDLH